ncbi:MAG: phosphoadenylyl-sulfate reductase [Spirulinaceae cyanobacterium]
MTQTAPLPVRISDLDLERLNSKFEHLHPKEILSWSTNFFPTGLVQASSFDIDDLVITDLLYRYLRPELPVTVLFVDTLHHFSETLQLVKQAKSLYGLDLQVNQMAGVDSAVDFAAKYGKNLWEKNLDKFIRLTRVRPLQQALQELNTQAWITSRRRSQSENQGKMPILELDSQGRLKINPLANWTRAESWAYAYEFDLIYNPLHDEGYSDISDQPLTNKVEPEENEGTDFWQGGYQMGSGIHIF